MEALRSYFLSVTAAALLCGILNALVQDKTGAGKMVKLICGLFLAFTVIRPVANIQIEEMALLTEDISRQAQEAADAGEEFAQDAMQSRIKEEVEAYILDKANSMHLELEVEVTVGGDTQLLPESVCITGSISGSAKRELQSMIEDDLGIAKENQIWMG